jgi:drug/metabolite transporter (DMT)-like permease
MGMSGIFVKWAGAPGSVSGFYRMIIAAALFALPFSLEVRRRPIQSARAIGLAVLAGLLFAGDLAFWNTAVLLTSAGNATFLGNTAPVWVGLGALLIFRQKLKPMFWVGLAVALSGAGVMLSGDFGSGANAGLGSLLALIAGVFYAGFFLAAQRAREGLSAFASWWISAAASAVALLGSSLLLGQPLLGYSLATYTNLVGLALVTQAGAYLLVNYALGHLPAPIVSTTLLLQPIVTTLVGIPLLGEWPTPLDVLGGALVLAGVWVVNRYGKTESTD